MFDLTGKTALITGASGGIGTRAAAKAEPDGYTLLMASTGALMAAAAALSVRLLRVTREEEPHV